MSAAQSLQSAVRAARAALERQHRRITIALALFVIYLLLGFFVAPLVLKGRLEQGLSAATGQRATLAEVKVNPLELSVRLIALRIAEEDGSPLLGVDDLYVNVQASSLFRGALTFGEIAIAGPWVEAVVEPDSTLNLSRIGSKDAAPPPPSSGPSEPPAVIIQLFSVSGGHLFYEDRTKAAPTRTEVRIVDLAARDLSTRRGEAGDYQLEATGQRARFRWKGQVGFNPIASEGTVSISGLDLASLQQEFAPDAIAGSVRSGNLDLSTGYSVARRDDGEFDLKLDDARANLEGFAFGARPTEAAGPAAAIELPKLEVSETTLDLRSQAVRIGRIAITEPRLRAVLGRDGLDLAALFQPAPATAPAPAPATSAAPAPAGPPWRVALAELALEGGRVEVTDATLAAPVTHTIAPLKVGLSQATLAPTLAFELAVDATINGGSLSLRGPVAARAPKADGAADGFDATLDLKLQGLGLAPYSPYLAGVGAMDLARGTLEAEGRIALAGEQLGYTGFVGSNDLALRDLGLKQDFLRWKRLQLRGMDLKLPPAPQLLSLSLKEVVLEQPYLRMLIGPDRITNIDHILGTDRPPAAAAKDGDDAEPAPAPAPTAPGRGAEAAKPAGPVPKVRVASVRIVDGSANFADRSLTPEFATAIGELNGTIKGLSSAEKTLAEVTIDGRVDKYAPVTLRGTFNPLAAKPTTDLALRFKDIELTTFTPYSGRFMGMKIEQGRLSLDLRYRLVDRMLEGDNKIVLDQFVLGENVESSEAMALPVRLAIALLKDSRGVIDLDLPVKGSLDDPQFSYGKIMWKAFVSLITKAVSAPFAALGSLFGGGPDLEKVAFAPGSTVPDPAQQARLDTIAKGLAAKPELRLDVPGASDPKLDGDFIARKKVLGRVRADGSAVDAATLTPKELRALSAQFVAKFPGVDPGTILVPTADGKAPDALALAGEQLNRLAAAEPADPAALAELARARGLAIKDYLVTRALLPPERIYLKDVNAIAGQKDGQVVVTLELSAP